MGVGTAFVPRGRFLPHGFDVVERGGLCGVGPPQGGVEESDPGELHAGARGTEPFRLDGADEADAVTGTGPQEVDGLHTGIGQVAVDRPAVGLEGAGADRGAAGAVQGEVCLG